MTNRRLKILYLPYKAHLYGDNLSLLGSLSILKNEADIMVCVTEEGLFTNKLKEMNIPYRVVSGVMAPYILFNYKHYTLRNYIAREIHHIIDSVRTFFQLRAVIRSYQPDIIHTNNSNIYSGAVMAKHFGIPHVWHIREYMDLDHDAQWPRKRFFDRNRKWSHCIAITRGLFDHYRMDEKKDAHIYNGICSATDTPRFQAEKQNYFLYIGRVVPTKGVEDMIEAFITFCQTHPDCQYRLKIAGDGETAYINKLKEKLQTAGVLNLVDFLGFQAEVFPLLQVAKALIVPSYFEAMGRITIEAMLAGCYVIGRNTAGTKELLDNEQTGLRFETKEELVQCLRSVIQADEDHLQAELERVQKHAIVEYSTEHNAKQILRFYHKILNHYSE